MSQSGRGSHTRCVRILVTGRVQGVWFRGSMVGEAERLGLAGWVKNLTNGDVEALVEGTDTAVGEIIAWCRSGPGGARVDSVETSEQAVAGRRGFTIEY